MDYICANCGRDVDYNENFIACSYCNSRIVIKKRPSIPREVSTD
ncbi:DNA-directed RNA polymerase subunit P [Candidatus Mancarchaeum acidiphilum]|uniref:DNA-directed RNA polymerase subunit Rpo12 n=1 Tax=Candidatus Mancarchaeum acidiphilum TaxID=1920749 RepID=A0A218NLR5_9ARCH|nr:DNA-directed RNA polymerase subunit P [Candidatus Mancarchaeum acidiphilum]ASI13398.1 DNA-directed RNA polymerase subunit P [Candidatus Mancarchaeum acidiphilum]